MESLSLTVTVSPFASRDSDWASWVSMSVSLSPGIGLSGLISRKVLADGLTPGYAVVVIENHNTHR